MNSTGRLAEHEEFDLRSVPRSRLLEVIRHAIERAKPEGRGIAVLMLAVDPKDRLSLFCQEAVYTRLDAAFRSLARSLRPADLVCMVGERQICIVLPDLATAAQATLAAHKLSRAICEALRDLPGEDWARVLVGISCFPDQAEDAQSLLRQADSAASQAEGSEDGICHFAKGSDGPSEEQLPVMRNQILEALRSSAFRLAYQPQLNLANGRCESAEALLRATLPDGTALSPPLVVAVAEQSGKIGFLTAAVLNATLRQLSLWIRAGLNMRVSVNLSPHNLRDTELPDVVARALETWRVRAELLTLEIVESSVIHSLSEAASILQRLKGLGVKLAIDDFGTGYSCLAYLRQLPLDELKVDRAFVRNLRQSKEDRQLVQATIDLAHNFDLRAVAEGVEDEATLGTLRDMGCDLIQGYVLSPALEAERFAGTLSRLTTECEDRCQAANLQEALGLLGMRLLRG